MSDGAEIDAGFKQVNRGAVSYAMWMDAFAFERRLDFRSALNVPFQDETRTEASEGFTLPVPKYELRFVWIETAVMEVCFSNRARIRPNWTEAFSCMALTQRT